MDYRYLQVNILALLKDSPLVRISAVKDVKEFLQVGEENLAFDTLCTWLYEDEVAISQSFYERLSMMSNELGAPESMAKLDELVVGQK